MTDRPDPTTCPECGATAWQRGRPDPPELSLDVERLADALTAAPSLLLEGDDRDRKEFAEWLLARLSGPPPEPKNE